MSAVCDTGDALSIAEVVSCGAVGVGVECADSIVEEVVGRAGGALVGGWSIAGSAGAVASAAEVEGAEPSAVTDAGA